MSVTATSMRAMVSGSGTVTLAYLAAKPWRLTFSTAQSFRRGEAVAIANMTDSGMNLTYGVLTIAFGAGTEWVAHQRCIFTNYGLMNSQTFYRTDTSTARTRGGGLGVPHRFIPGAQHFLYVSPLDQSGVFDWYTYVDTVFPVNGRHPYTRDRWSGLSWIADDKHPTEDGVLVADTANRIAALDAQPPVLSV
jgi:hypothetical protein